MPRLASITLDSAERSFVLDLAKDGQLPAIAGLLDRGTWCPIRTPVPYRSEYATTEFVTGRSAAQNRYWSTISFDPATYDCVTVGAAVRTPFYSSLAPRPRDHLRRPAFDPDPDVVGVQIVGWAGHDARFQHPRAAVSGRAHAGDRRRFGTDPVVDVEYRGSWHQEPHLVALADALITSARRRGDIACWLLGRFPEWDLFLMGMPELHSAGHAFCHGVDPGSSARLAPDGRDRPPHFVDVYRAVDETIGRIAAALPDDTLDHAGRPERHAAGSGRRRVGLVAPRVPVPALVRARVRRRADAPDLGARGAIRRSGPIPADRAGPAGPPGAEGPLAGLKRRYHTVAPRGVVDAGRRLRAATRRSPPPALPSAPPEASSSPTATPPRSWDRSTGIRRCGTASGGRRCRGSRCRASRTVTSA